MAIDENDAELILKWYTDLESRFVGVIHTVPITQNTRGVSLPALTSIIIDSCSLIDTIFRSSLPSKQQKDANIKTYAMKFEAEFKLSSKRSIVYQFPVSAVAPFGGWLSGSSANAPSWWKAHNKLKHDRLRNYTQSTIETTLLSLAALHQVIAINQSFLEPLLRRDMLSFGTFAWAYALSEIRSGKSRIGHPGLMETELFASLCGRASFDEDLDRIPLSILGQGQRLARFLGRQY